MSSGWFHKPFFLTLMFDVQKRGHSWQLVSEETQMMDKHTMNRRFVSESLQHYLFVFVSHVYIISCSVSAVTCDVVPHHVMKSLPMVRVRKESKLLHPGVQCRICLSRFQTGQNVRSLPCKHKVTNISLQKINKAFFMKYILSILKSIY